MVRIFLFVLLLPITWAFAKSPESCLISKCSTSTIFRILIEQTDSIEFFDGEKLYLKAENIRHTNGRQVLCNGHSVIFLPALSMSEQGYYYLPYRKDEDVKLKCSKCGFEWWFTKEWTIYCPRCGEIGE